MKKKINQSIFKKAPEELQEYLHFRKRGHRLPNKKAYKRKNKHKENMDE